MLIVISGPIASGKSTVARALAQQLERTGSQVAVIDLDLVHNALQHAGSASGEGDAAWPRARQAQRDPTRGVSRDPSFLLPYYARVSPALASLPETDIVIDTELLTEEEVASVVARRIANARDAMSG